jgi:glutathione synthetase
MRKDPPVDANFILATWCLDRAAKQTLVINEPGGLRDLSEKLAILEFPEFIPQSYMLRTTGDLRDALAALGGQMIIKPVYGFGGREVLIAREGDPNLSTLFELATRDGTTWTIAQAFVPEAKNGDKRILMVDGEPIGAVMRVPASGEIRNNFPCRRFPRRDRVDRPRPADLRPRRAFPPRARAILRGPRRPRRFSDGDQRDEPDRHAGDQSPREPHR